MKGLNFIIGILISIIILLIMYIILLRRQFTNINRQLDKRLKGHSRQPVSIELINHQLNQLVININNCLKAEENLRLVSVREEKKFKELIANISHDLRTPLTAIKGYLQLIDNSELKSDQKDKLQIARKHSDELEQLISHFFEYSYLIISEPQLKMERINLTNLVAECLAESVPTLENHNLTLHFEETKTIFVLGDKESILRIVQNLIRNCIQHAKGDIEVRLFEKNQAVLSFQNLVNNDSEINPYKLFDRFYTGDKARSNSSGLGLSIVRILAEQMGGCAGASIENGKIDIHVRLPLYPHDEKNIKQI